MTFFPAERSWKHYWLGHSSSDNCCSSSFDRNNAAIHDFLFIICLIRQWKTFEVVEILSVGYAARWLHCLILSVLNRPHASLLDDAIIASLVHWLFIFSGANNLGWFWKSIPSTDLLFLLAPRKRGRRTNQFAHSSNFGLFTASILSKSYR